MKLGALICVFFSACLMRVELGGDAPLGDGVSDDTSAPAKDDTQKPVEKRLPPNGTALRVTDLQIELKRVTPASFTRSQTGDVLVAADDALITITAGKHTVTPYHVSGGPSFHEVRGVAALGEALVLATDEGPLLCTPEEKLDCERLSQEGVVGFAALPPGRVLFARAESVGTLRAQEPFFSPPNHVEAPAAFVATTRSWRWLLHAGAPYACRLDHPPAQTQQPIDCDADLTFTAPVRQAIELDDATTAFATDGAGVRLLIGEKQKAWDALPDQRVNDLVVWQGDLWAATERGLAQLDPKSFESAAPDPASLGALAEQPVVALALSDDGGLIAAIGRNPVRLYQLGAN